MTPKDLCRDGSQVLQPFEIQAPEAPEHSSSEQRCKRTAVLVALYTLGSVGLTYLMKFLFSYMWVSAGQLQVHGLPAPLFWTTTQLAISFGCFAASSQVHWCSHGRWGYRPPPLNPRIAKQVALLALSFATSIGLNNLSLSMVSLSVNNMIRSTSPLTTALAATIWTRGAPSSEQWIFVVLGTLFVLINVLASQPAAPSTQSTFTLGVAAGFLSTVGGAFMFIIVELFKGSSIPLNAIDSTGYMSLPAAALLTPWIFLFPHAAGNWPERLGTSRTDSELLGMVSDHARLAAAVALSGFAAYGYNVLQFYTVQELSSTQTAFASNVSKAVLCLLSWILLEPATSSKLRSWLVVLSAAGGLTCFFLYALSKTRSLRQKSRGIMIAVGYPQLFCWLSWLLSSGAWPTPLIRRRASNKTELPPFRFAFCILVPLRLCRLQHMEGMTH